MHKMIGVLLGLLALGVGLYAAHWFWEEAQYRNRLADQRILAGDRESFAKRPVACPDPAKTDVFVAFGQSNAANHGATLLSAPEGSYDFFRGTCFSGDDPQASATGKGGSIWPAFAESWKAQTQRNIMLTSVARGNTAIAEWLEDAEDSNYADYLAKEVQALQSAGYRVTAFLFFQGENDRDTPAEDYANALRKVAVFLERISPQTPFVISDSSICGPGTQRAAQLITARQAVIEEQSNAFHGPDTDQLNEAFRYDACHFNERGQLLAGHLWARAVSEILE